MNFIYGNNESNLAKVCFYPFGVGIVLFATYFLVNEMRQLKNDGFDYLLSMWNYIDLIPPIGIYLIVVLIIL